MQPAIKQRRLPRPIRVLAGAGGSAQSRRPPPEQDERFANAFGAKKLGKVVKAEETPPCPHCGNQVLARYSEEP
jgi:hypothetical protein